MRQILNRVAGAGAGGEELRQLGAEISGGLSFEVEFLLVFAQEPPRKVSTPVHCHVRTLCINLGTVPFLVGSVSLLWTLVRKFADLISETYLAQVHRGHKQDGLDQFQAMGFVCVPVHFAACMFEDSKRRYLLSQCRLVDWLFLLDFTQVSAQRPPKLLLRK